MKERGGNKFYDVLILNISLMLNIILWIFCPKWKHLWKNE